MSGGKSFFDDEYTATAKIWSRFGEIYSGIDSTFRLNALLMSKEWRKVYVEKVSAHYGMNLEEHDKTLDDQMRADASSSDFIMAIEATQDELQKLKSRSEVWELYAIQGDVKTYPLEIRTLDWPATKLEALLPFYNPWQRFYKVRFPKFSAGKVSIHFTGHFGRIVSTWEDAL